MDPNLKRNFSYPNSDQYNSQTGSDISLEENTAEKDFQPRKTVNIIEALANSRKDNDDVQTLRTYQSDIANTIKNDNVSMIKIALSEKKRQEKRSQFDNTIEENRKNIYLLVGVIITFIVMAGLTAGYIYLQSTDTASGTSQTQQRIQPLLYTESTSILNIEQFNTEDLVKIIERDKEAVMELGDMKSIVLTAGSSTEERQLTSEEFFYLLKSRAPDGLIRALDTNFLLGVYAFTPREMFAVFKVNSYDTAFAGMFEWEPNIESDIGDIFINKKERIGRNISALSNVRNIEQDAAGTTTAQSSPFGVFSQRKFVDKVLSNKDARVLVDIDNREAMLYTFLDKETLVIATSEKSLKEIIFRLTTGRIVR